MKQKSFALVVTLLALFLASSLTARPAFACGCGDGISYADVIFTGKVTYVPKDWLRGPRRHVNWESYIVKMEVQSISKGNVGSNVTLGWMASCTYPFKQGGTYRVYARYALGDSSKLHTTICSSNNVISEPVVDLTIDNTPPEGSIPPETLLLLGTLVGTLALALVLDWLNDRRRRKGAEMLD
jgi:hypothetical protein